jgi:hypothetical protein
MVFSRLPDSFFAPLASPNRTHYAALILIYYRLFLEYHSGVERDLVIARFAEYFAGLDSQDLPGHRVNGAGAVAHRDSGGAVHGGAVDNMAREGVANRDGDGGRARDGGSAVLDGERNDGDDHIDAGDPRGLAAHFLRRLISFGWMDEEQQLDFSRLVTLKSYARPFFEALDATDRGAEVEYESHIVAIYSSLTGDAAREHGEHAVLNAHYHTRLLIESLKVLEQNIRSHVQAMFDQDQSIPDILHSHYDVYMHEVVDRAYTRLKTSDNLSRYRPRIARAISSYLADRSWMDRTAERLSIIQRVDSETARTRARNMLVDIRDDLKSIDPILESIDDRNRRYSRISTERIRAKLYADTTLQGRLSTMISQITDGFDSQDEVVELKSSRLRYLETQSLYVSRSREIGPSGLTRPVAHEREEELAAAEMRLRVSGQLNPKRVAEFLEARCARPGESVWGHELADDMDSFVRLLYAASYAERNSDVFPYSIEWLDDRVSVGEYVLPRHRFIRRHGRG